MAGGIGVGVAVGIGVGVAVGTGVGVAVGTGVGVAVGIGVGVAVGIGVGVAVGTGVGVAVGTGVGVAVGTGVGVAVGTGIWVGVGEGIGASGVNKLRVNAALGLSDGGAIVGAFSWTNLTITVRLASMSIFAVLPDTPCTGPTHSSTFQPGLGSTSMVTVRPET